MCTFVCTFCAFSHGQFKGSEWENAYFERLLRSFSPQVDYRQRDLNPWPFPDQICPRFDRRKWKNRKTLVVERSFWWRWGESNSFVFRHQCRKSTPFVDFARCRPAIVHQLWTHFDQDFDHKRGRWSQLHDDHHPTIYDHMSRMSTLRQSGRQYPLSSAPAWRFSSLR